MSPTLHVVDIRDDEKFVFVKKYNFPINLFCSYICVICVIREKDDYKISFYENENIQNYVLNRDNRTINVSGTNFKFYYKDSYITIMSDDMGFQINKYSTKIE